MMLVPRPRRQEAPSRGKKISPLNARSLLIVCFIALSHGVICQLEGRIPSTWNKWSSLRTAQMARHNVNEAPGNSVPGGSLSGGSSPLNVNNIIYVITPGRDGEEPVQYVHRFVPVDP